MFYKILIVCSGNAGQLSPFIKSQAGALQSAGIKIDFYPIIGKGFFGYLFNLFKLKKKLRNFLLI